MQFLSVRNHQFAAAHWATTFCLVALLTISTPALPGQAPESMGIVKQFLAPGASIAPLQEWSPTSGAVVKSTPAVFESTLVMGEGPDLVFAEDAKLDQGRDHVLTVSVLRREQGGYRRLFCHAYFDKILHGQEAKTIGLQTVALTGQRNGLLIITSTSAALGGDLEILTWKDGLGFVNVVPERLGGGHQFTWATRQGRLEVQVGPERAPCGDSGVG